MEENKINSFEERLNILKIFIVLFSLILILRLLSIVLNYIYKFNGFKSELIPLIVFIFGINFIYISFNYIKKISHKAIIGFNSIKEEWEKLSKLKKIETLSSLLSFLIILMTILQKITPPISKIFDGLDLILKSL